MDSDAFLFGGYGRVSQMAEFFTSVRLFPRTHSRIEDPPNPHWASEDSCLLLQEGWYDERPRSFLVYAPCRTVAVYTLVEDEIVPEEDPIPDLP